MLNKYIKKRISIAALVAAVIAAMVVAVMLISDKNKTKYASGKPPETTTENTEIHAPIKTPALEEAFASVEHTPYDPTGFRTFVPADSRKITPNPYASSSADSLSSNVPSKKPKTTPYSAPIFTHAPTSTPIPAHTTPANTSPLHGKDFMLTILGQNIPVSVGVDRPTLAQNPGWLETSAYPGEEGVCVVYGHRNRNHLKVLKDVDFGDTITVTLEDGSTISYTVVSIKILEADNELRVPLLSGQHIMLTTCYPFYYTGHAQGKYVVILQAID